MRQLDNTFSVKKGKSKKKQQQKQNAHTQKTTMLMPDNYFRITQISSKIYPYVFSCTN